MDNENKEIVPTYNRSGGLEKVHLDGDEYVKEIAYDAKGQRLLISFGNGVMNRYAYDAQNFRLKRMKSEKYTYSESATERTYEVLDGTTRQDIGYEYDLNGNILKKKNRTPDCGISGTALGVDALDNLYTYDAISRLLNASGRESDANNESHRWADAPAAGSPNASNIQSYNRQYTYDKVGNIKTLQQTGTNAFTRTFNYTDNTLNNITVSSTPTAFTYDANGNMTQSGSSRYYEWDEHDQLVFFKVQAGGTPSVYAHYLYDSGGNRTKKIVWDQQGNKEVTVYIDGIFEYRLKQEDGQDKEQNIIHVMDDAARIAQVRIGTEFNGDIGNEITYILDDHLGSSNTRLDDNGSIIDHQEYYPFGDTSLRTYSKKRYQFIGREKDAESGLHYWSARYYSSWMCRFISVDKMASSYAHLTPYNYADNDPINDFDIDGNQNGNTKQTTEDTGNNGGNPPQEGNSNNNVLPESKVLGVDPTIITYKESQEMLSQKKASEKVTIKDGVLKGDIVTNDITKVTEREEMKNINYIVLHRTVSSSAKSSIKETKSSKGETGFHVVVDTDGTITQVNNLNNRANHVGKQKGNVSNNNSIGIEVVGRPLNQEGKVDLNVTEKTISGWEALTPEQITSVTKIIEAVMSEYKLGLNSIKSHEDVSWKMPGEGKTVYNSVKGPLGVVEQQSAKQSFNSHKKSLHKQKSVLF